MKNLAIVIFSLLGAISYGRDANDARIIAAYSTRTAVTLTTITTVHPYTCFSDAPGENPCQKRRLRRQFPLMRHIRDADLTDEKLLLDSTIEDPLTSEARGLDANNREGRIALTVWTTSSSTFTVTSTSINTQITFSISYFCTINGFPFVPACA